MKEPEVCPQEHAVVAARREGRSSTALTAHLAECASCREADRVADWMRGLAATPIEKPLPDADVVWMMAQVSKPPRLRLDMRILEGVAPLALAALLVVWNWSLIESVIGGLVPMRAMGLVPLLVSCFGAAILAAVALATEGPLRED